MEYNKPISNSGEYFFFFGREKKQDYYYRYILDICNITHEEKRFQIKILYIHILRIEKNIWKYNQIN